MIFLIGLIFIIFMTFKIEIATSDFVTTKAAYEGGADRIELCANLAEGGTTPSFGLIKKSCENFGDTEIYAMIRPRGGDFLYTGDEFEIMLQDVKLAKDLNCDGVVFGLLNIDGNIDIKRTSRLVESAYPLGVTFHRAFDRCRDPFEALEQLIDIGCERILTSGQTPNVMDSLKLVKDLNDKADGRIIIMPGSGVNVGNVGLIKDQTGCYEFHASLRSKKESEMDFKHPGFINDAGSYINNFIDADEVKQFKLAVS